MQKSKKSDKQVSLETQVLLSDTNIYLIYISMLWALYITELANLYLSRRSYYD